MSLPLVDRDERTVAVENASYRWGFQAIAYGLLVVVAYRAYVIREAAWELLVLVVIGGAVASVYQWAHHVLSRRSAQAAVLACCLAAMLAAVIVLLR